MQLQESNKNNQNGQNYFEKQSSFSLYCGIHSVNNLLGKKQFKKQQFDKICKNLSDDFINPYKHVLGGDYDVSVLIMALQSQQCQTEWHDLRKKMNLQSQLNNQDKKLVGFLLNIKLPQKWYHNICRTSGKHWICIKITEGKKENQLKFHLLDSLEQQKITMDTTQTENYLNKANQNNQQILKIFKKSTK